MNRTIGYLVVAVMVIPVWAWAQSITPDVRDVLDRVDQLLLDNHTEKALETLDKAIERHVEHPDDRAYLYANKSGICVSSYDSLLLGKRLLDSSMAYAQGDLAKAMAYRASANLNNHLNRPDQVVNDALAGLTYLDAAGPDADPVTAYALNYLLYGAHSKWGDSEKMEQYIRQCLYHASRAGKPNLLANALNGMSTMYSTAYQQSKNRALLDSTFQYLRQAFVTQRDNPGKVGGNTVAITCINLANYFLEYSARPLVERKKEADRYLAIAERELNRNRASADKWVNVFGIKSGFALNANRVALAEQYLLQGISRMQDDSTGYPKEEHLVFSYLSDIAEKKGDHRGALRYQRLAEEKLREGFYREQVFNAQKLEIQYETEKKDEQLALLGETALLRKQQNYLYGGLALAMLVGLVFMVSSYRFKLRYSRERERKLAQEKTEAERLAAMQLRMEKEEQARLKAEQELLELQRQQLRKEALANSLIIEQKNDTLNQIRDNLKAGDAQRIQRLLKKETLLNTDFEEIKVQLQELHPGFFRRLNEQSVQKLTLLDLKYCTYIYLKMDTRQIAQALHVETQSVRMFKYRLKQKLGLAKAIDLEQFIQHIED